MLNLEVSDEFDCTKEAYWTAFRTPEYGRTYYLEEMQAFSYEVLEQSETKGEIRIVPRLNMPGPVMKVLGDRPSYVEHSVYDPAAHHWSWHWVPAVMPDKLSVKGSMTLEDAGEGRTRRIHRATLEAKVFGVGSLIEKATEKEIRDAWSKETPFMRRWLATHR
ncbi:MAG: DUF2505 domain-containing protein [Myxococcota bacterium]